MKAGIFAMAAAAYISTDCTFAGSGGLRVQAPATAERGHLVAARLGTALSDVELVCVEAAIGKRTIFLAKDKARVTEVPGDGSCAYYALIGSLQVCLGVTKAPAASAVKAMLETSLEEYILGADASRALRRPGVSKDQLKEVLQTLLSRDQWERARYVECTEFRNSWLRQTIEPEPAAKDRSFGWLRTLLEKKVTNKKHPEQAEFLHMTWFAFVAEKYGVNIAVWEPTGEGMKAKLYAAVNYRGLFLYDKKDRMDEAGHHWVHLLHRKCGSWEARDESHYFNHFDWLQLGSTAKKSFEDIIAGSQPPTDGEEETSSCVSGGGLSTNQETENPGKGGAATNARGTRSKPKPGKTALKETDKARERMGKRKINKPAAKETDKSGGRLGKRKGVGSSTKAAAGANKKLRGGGGQGGAPEYGGDTANYDSDGEIGEGDMDHLHHTRKGAFAAFSVQERKINKDMKAIPEETYRRAYYMCNKRKARGKKRLAILERQKKVDAINKKRAEDKAKNPGMKQKPAVYPKEIEALSDGEDETRWSERGIAEFGGSAAHQRRSKKNKERTEVSLSAEARAKMPSLDDLLSELPSESAKYSVEDLVLPCFDMNFPSEAVDLFVEKTNAYVEHCTTEPLLGEVDRRKPHQMSKSSTLGRTTLPEPAFEAKHIHGMVGCFITMGLTKKTRMRKHWSRASEDDYPLVRMCMQRDLFELLYSRFLHCSDANAPPRLLEGGEQNPDFDSKWHIRELEDILNKAWVENVEVGQWLSYDEQMVKTVSTFSSFLSRYNKDKPISRGIKLWALASHRGYCLISVVDGGMYGDPKLRPWFDCPLGRTTRQVLFVMLKACPELGAKLEQSGVYVAMDNYFTSPTLFECLRSHGIFACGTCRSDRTGGAMEYLGSLERKVTERGDMVWARSGEVTCVKWKDSNDVILLSTIHIAQPSEEEREEGAIDHFKPQPLELRKKGNDGKRIQTFAPTVRMDYGNFMQGVDRSDQQNTAHSHDHKACSNYWRRVMDQKIEQALTNSFRCQRMWVDLLAAEANMRKEAEATTAKTKKKLGWALTNLRRLSKLERVEWDTMMARKLMARCNVGSINTGGAQTEFGPRPKVWGSVFIPQHRLCSHPFCTSRSKKGCDCDQCCRDCTEPGVSGVLMCKTCFDDESRHVAAADAYHANAERLDGERRRKAVQWQKRSI